MLVLTRRDGESVCVGNGIVITVLANRGGKVRLGIQAPPDIRVDRLEVRDRIGGATDAISGRDIATRASA